MTKPRVAQLLEKITRFIPGISGYQDRELRRDADRAVRSKAADEVGRCREIISEAMNDLSRSGGLRNLRVIGQLERITTKLERTEDELRLAPSGYAGWFDSDGITIEDLEKLYEYDLGLLSAARTLPDYIGEVTHVGTDHDWSPGFIEALNNLREAYEVRRRVIEGREDEIE